jgi:hypothetical protein
VLSQQAGLTANVTQASLSVTGLTASNKTYDTTTVAALGGTATATALAGDTVTLGGTAVGSFANKNVGTAKAVTVTGKTISGADAANYALSQQAGLSANVTQASLAVTGLTAQNKTYDTTIVAPLGGTATVAALAGDSVTLGGTAVGSFADKNVGSAKAVTVTGNTISGTDAANYVLSQQAGLSANVTQASLAVTGLTAVNKTYDTTTAAPLGGTAAVAAMAGDTVTLGGTAVGSFADKNVGAAKAVTVTGNSISGPDAANYALSQQAGLRANVTQASLTVTGLTAVNKIYDTTTVAVLGGSAAVTALAGDVVTLGGTAIGSFANKNVGTAKAVTVTGNTISGADAANYILVQQMGLTADVTQASLNVTGLIATNKIYDTTSVATLGGAASITALSGDSVALAGTAVGSFADNKVGTAKAVTVVGNTISGTDAANYALVQQSGLSADISPAPAMNDISAFVVANAALRSSPAIAVTVAQAPTGAVLNPVDIKPANAAFVDGSIGGSGGVSATVPSNAPSGSNVPAALPLETGLTNNLAPLPNVSVQVLRLPSASQEGLVEVLLPKEALWSKAGFAFALPTSVTAKTAVAPSTSLVTAGSVDGTALPDWLTFDPVLQKFSAWSAPADAFPIRVVLTDNGVKTTILIGELP